MRELQQQCTEVSKIIVARAAATIPATTQTPYFTITGRVLVTALIGEVTTAIQDQACDLDVWLNPAVGSDVALCAVLNIQAKPVGTILAIDGAPASAMVATETGSIFPVAMIPAQGLLLAAGNIDFKTSATNTGATKWTIHYIPFDSNSKIVTA